jgi:hypothetical protein
MIDFVVAADDLTCCAVFVPKFVLSQPHHQMKRDYIGQLGLALIERFSRPLSCDSVISKAHICPPALELVSVTANEFRIGVMCPWSALVSNGSSAQALMHSWPAIVIGHALFYDNTVLHGVMGGESPTLAAS